MASPGPKTDTAADVTAPRADAPLASMSSEYMETAPLIPLAHVTEPVASARATNAGTSAAEAALNVVLGPSDTEPV
ncbi:MAG: hypothetical protein U0235_33845 [Polyangiaceae bacterium]